MRAFRRHRAFELAREGDEDAVLSAIVEVLDGDDAIVDLCAWPLGRPREFATLLRAGDGLGVWRVQDRGSYQCCEANALRVFRTPGGMAAGALSRRRGAE